jgi:hypothetical protein
MRANRAAFCVRCERLRAKFGLKEQIVVSAIIGRCTSRYLARALACLDVASSRRRIPVRLNMYGPNFF